MYKHLLRCVLLMLLVTGSLRAQERQISGTVRDDRGQGQPVRAFAVVK